MSNNQPVYFIYKPDRIGEMIFTFDGKRKYNLFRDYPKALTPTQKQIFDKTFPFWARYFSDRSQ